LKRKRRAIHYFQEGQVSLVRRLSPRTVKKGGSVLHYRILFRNLASSLVTRAVVAMVILAPRVIG
jgi:hypothetical protein